MKQLKYHNLCAKALAGEITDQEKEILDSWIKDSPANKAYYEDVHKAWEFASPVPVPPMPSVDEAWAEIAPITRSIPQKGWNQFFTNIVDRMRRFAMPPLRPAMISLAATAVAVIALIIINPFIDVGTQQVTTYNKQKMLVDLSDGSRIHINSGSTLKFPKQFTDEIREVHLTGEAFFEIKTDERPFVVVTATARTTVLGTKFNVRARDASTLVIVKEGSVLVSSADTEEEEVILTQNQMSRVADHVAPEDPQDVDAEHLIGWLENRLVFERTPLNEIVRELERFYDIRVHLADRKLADRTMTGTFENLPIETVLQAICTTLNSEYSMVGTSYRITGQP